jgi:hypothetical protein
LAEALGRTGSSASAAAGSAWVVTLVSPLLTWTAVDGAAEGLAVLCALKVF